MRIKDINIDMCMSALDARNASLVNREAITTVPLSDITEVAVEWGPFAITKDLAHYEAFLKYYTWSTNGTNPDTEKRYVEGDDPNDVAFKVEQQEFYGRWRQAFVRTRRETTSNNTDVYYVGITLRKGWATKLSEDEAWLGNIRANATTGALYITRFWRNVSYKHVVSLTDTLKATAAVTDPKMQGETKTGTYNVSKVEGDISDQDGSGVISQTFVDPKGDGVVLSYLENCDVRVDITFKHDLTEAEV